MRALTNNLFTNCTTLRYESMWTIQVPVYLQTYESQYWQEPNRTGSVYTWHDYDGSRMTVTPLVRYSRSADSLEYGIVSTSWFEFIWLFWNILIGERKGPVWYYEGCADEGLLVKCVCILKRTWMVSLLIVESGNGTTVERHSRNCQTAAFELSESVELCRITTEELHV